MDAALNVSGLIDDKAERQLREATAREKAFLAGGVVDKVNRLARRKIKEINETAKKIEELEGLRKKFIGIEKVAKGTSTNTVAPNTTNTASTITAFTSTSSTSTGLTFRTF